jgi:hypothetical protein
MPVSQLPQAPYRQDRKVFPTPLVGDVLFSEVRDCNRGNPFPEYGTPYPNANKWPDHKLVYIKPVDIERNEIFEFFYAAERENQDLYNFSFGLQGIGPSRQFRVVQRSYVTLRENFQPLDIPFGTAMPNIPEDKFDGVEYVFFDRQQQRINEQELDSLYVAEVHTYIETAFLDYKLSYGTQKSDVVPEKFRVSIPQTTTEQIVEGLAEQPVLTGSQLSVTEDQINPDIKLVRTVSRDKPTENVTLSGSQSYVGGTVSISEETFSSGLLEADSGYLIQESRVTPLGDGSYVKETVKVGEWPTLYSGEWDDLLDGVSVKKQEVVTSNSANDVLQTPNTPYSVDYEAVNKDRTVKITSFAPKEINSYIRSHETRINLNLPPMLKKIGVIWDEDRSDGFYSESQEASSEGVSDGSISSSASGNASGSASATPELDIELEEIWSTDLIATNYYFFTDKSEKVIDKLRSLTGDNIKSWPIFKPKIYRLVATGKSVSSSVRFSTSKSESKSEDREATSKGGGVGATGSVDTDIKISRIGPCLCAGVTISGGTFKNVTARVTGTYTANQSAFASVSPISFAATSPPSVPNSGLYLIDSKVDPYKWGYNRCVATVFDASQFK